MSSLPSSCSSMPPTVAPPATGGGNAPTAPAKAQAAPAQAPAAPPTGPDALQRALLVPLLQLTQALSGLVGALGGSQLIPPAGTTTTPATTAPTTTPPGSAPSGDPLVGFFGTGDPGERAQLGTALRQIGSTSVGAGLLGAVRDKGIHLDIVTDAEFAAVTGNPASTALAVFRGGGTAPPSVFVKASALKAGELTHVVAHELAHAAQFLQGEDEARYAAGLGAAGTALTASQRNVGAVLMRESGSELVASAIDAQLVDPAGFAAKARGNLDAAAQGNWAAVNSVYNPTGIQVPTLVSPTSVQLVRTALGA